MPARVVPEDTITSDNGTPRGGDEQHRGHITRLPGWASFGKTHGSMFHIAAPIDEGTWGDVGSSSNAEGPGATATPFTSNASATGSGGGHGGNDRATDLDFRDEWLPAFRSEQYSPNAVCFLSATMTGYFLVRAVLGIMRETGEWGGDEAARRMWTPLLVGALGSLITFIAFCLSSLRPLCLRFYDPLAALWNTFAYVAAMGYFQQYDSRNFLAGGGGIAPYQFKNVTFEQSDEWQSSGGWFGRYVCTDSFAEGTLLLPMRGMMQPGCRCALAVSTTVIQIFDIHSDNVMSNPIFNYAHQ